MEPPRKEPNENTSNGTEQHFKASIDIRSLSRKKIDDSKTILGKRYLCRGGGMWIIAPSGLGKSTLSIQIAILWACGKSAFDIKPSKSLRILVVQAEDDEGDCIEMSLMINHLGLSEKEKILVGENTEIVHCNDLSGSMFIDALKRKLKAAKDAGRPFDLVIINPYGVYQGQDVSNPVDNTHFLNHLLNPVLSDYDLAAVIIHHTPKTNFTNFDKLNLWDFQYAGAGSANMTNWARAIMVIVPQSVERLFLFVAAKRGSRLDGWNGVSTRLFSWSDMEDVMMWINPSQEQRARKADGDQKRQNPNYKPDSEKIFAACLSPVEWRHFVAIHELVTGKWPGFGIKRLKLILKAGVHDGLLEYSKSDGSLGDTTKPFDLWRKNGR